MDCPVPMCIDTKKIITDIKNAYLDDTNDFPWIIGFSGGKDSTILAHLVFDSLMGISPKKRQRKIYIISNDTLVESPIVATHMNETLKKIYVAAKNLKLPIDTYITKPELNQTFWSLLIGKGYPSPNLSMRWCTDRLKIKPTSKFIIEHVKASGSVVILLGVRKDESRNRKRSIDRHSSGQRYSPHPSLKGAFIYKPIVDLSTEEVWHFLWLNDPLWGGTHEDLFRIYKEADAGECPLIISKEEAPGCGTNSSRFGCWVCTVVHKDKSLQAAVAGGRKELLPLIEFRDWLISIRNKPEMRQVKRRNGKLSFGANQNHIPGPFTIKARKIILEKLLTTQQLVGIEIISQAEIDIIHHFWAEDMQRETL